MMHSIFNELKKKFSFFFFLQFYLILFSVKNLTSPLNVLVTN